MKEAVICITKVVRVEVPDGASAYDIRHSYLEGELDDTCCLLIEVDDVEILE